VLRALFICFSFDIIDKIKFWPAVNQIIANFITAFAHQSFIIVREGKNMRIAITGSSGSVGQQLLKEFQGRKWEIIPITRHELYHGGEELAAKINGAIAVINLAGAPILHRWTRDYKKVMVSSRVETAKNLAAAIDSLKEPPAVFISVSAVGIYSSETINTEEKAVLVKDFLGELCQEWESAARIMQPLTRSVIFRLGVVLDNDSGALQRMMLPFRLGLGGPIGSGKQYFSWIHMYDLVRAFVFAIENNISGVFNACAPEYTTGAAFSDALAAAMHRPSLVRIPSFVLRVLYGDGAVVLTSGQAAVPEKLIRSGFVFDYPQLTAALKNLITNKEQ
jgi:uncharacterized protein